MKQYDRVIVMGCSFVSAGHLQDYGGLECGNTHFIMSLQDKLKCTDKVDFWGNKTHNIGEAGVSNDYICRNMMEWLIDNPDRIKNTLFIIGLTELSRIEYWSSVDERYRSFYPNEDTDDFWNKKLFSGSLSKKEGKRFIELFYKYTYDDTIREKELYLKLSMIQDYMKSRGATLLLFSSLCEEFNHKEEFNYMDIPNHNTWNDWYTEKNGGYTRPEKMELEHYMAPDGHPGPKAYMELSDMLYEKVRGL